MVELDFTEQLSALRETFGNIRSVVDVDRLQREIADLSEQAGAQDLWDDVEHAQQGGPVQQVGGLLQAGLIDVGDGDGAAV